MLFLVYLAVLCFLCTCVLLLLHFLRTLNDDDDDDDDDFIRSWSFVQKSSFLSLQCCVRFTVQTLCGRLIIDSIQRFVHECNCVTVHN